MLSAEAFAKVDPAERCWWCDHARAIHGQDPLDTSEDHPTQCLAPATCPCMEFVLLEGRG